MRVKVLLHGAALTAAILDGDQPQEVRIEVPSDAWQKYRGEMLVLPPLEKKKLTSPPPEQRAELRDLESAPLATGIDRRELLRTLRKEIEDPSRIFQGKRFSCGAASVAIILSRNNPEEYVRLISGLASPEGKVVLQNGDTIERQKNTIFDDGSKRTCTSRLLHTAFMQYADGALDYDNLTEMHRGSLTGFLPGLVEAEVKRLAEGVLGGTWEIIGAGADTLGRDVDFFGGLHNVGARLKNTGTNADAFAAMLEGGDCIALINNRKHICPFGTHFVVIRGVRDGRVYFDDPQRITPADPRFKKMYKGYRSEPDGLASMPLETARHRLFSVIRKRD
jgi:hypothetical protein